MDENSLESYFQNLEGMLHKWPKTSEMTQTSLQQVIDILEITKETATV
jgi:hypothetical protein